MSAFSHHCWLLFNFSLVTGRSVGIFCLFRRYLCYPETLQLLSISLNPVLLLSQMQLGHFRDSGVTCPCSGPCVADGPCTVLCWQAPEQHGYSSLAFSISQLLTEPSVHFRGTGLCLQGLAHSPGDLSHPGAKVQMTHPLHSSSHLLWDDALESCQVQTWRITYKWHVHDCFCLDCWYKSWNFSSLVTISAVTTVLWCSLVDIMLAFPGRWECWVQDWIVPQVSQVSHGSSALSV